MDNDGVQLFYREVGTGPPVVLVHGGPGLPHAQLLPYCDRLAGRFRAIYYDQRGCGRSGDPPSLEALGWQDHVADLRALVREVAGGRVGLVGFSWGALLALFYALAHAADLACLALVAPTPAHAEGWYEDYRRVRSAREAALGIPERRRALEASDLKARDPAAYGRERYWLDIAPELADAALARRLTPVVMDERGTLANIFTWTSVGNYDLRPALRDLAVPALVVHGRHDPRPLACAREIAETLPNGQLVVFEDSGHVPFAEEPDRFFPLLERFLAEHLGG